VNPLQELIQGRLAERRWSYGDVARRGDLPRSTVYKLATTDRLHRPPQAATLAALARGLDVPLEVVNAAATSAAGLSVGNQSPIPPEVAALVADLARLSPADRQHVAALVESLLRLSPAEAVAEGSSATPSAGAATARSRTTLAGTGVDDHP
jgi:transcriptional regulator with XRE-family HTH domain